MYFIDLVIYFAFNRLTVSVTIIPRKLFKWMDSANN